MPSKESEMTSVLRVTRRYRAPQARIFNAWTDPATAGTWLFATASRPMARVQIDARVGGRFRLVDERDGEVIEYSGDYVEVSPYRRLAFVLVLPNPTHISTRVIVEIVPHETGSRLTLLHENVPAEMASYIKARWTGILYGLGVTLDVRQVRPEKFDDPRCRFRVSPIDYRIGRPPSTTIGSEP
jgi:uncharacterized protein YndB with AHSA1/START domain